VWLFVLVQGTRTRRKWFAEIAAGLFAVHPLATEAVTYVNSRSGVLAAFFGLAAMVAYLRFHDRRSWRSYGLSILCMALAMGSKESAVVAPVLLWLYLAVFRHDGDWRAALRASKPLVPLALCIALVPILFAVATNPHRGTIGAGTLPVFEHLLTQLRVLTYFLRLMFLPVEQNLDYDFAVSIGPDLAVLGSLAVLALVTGVAVWQRRRMWPVSFGVAWFFVAIAPTNSLVPFKDFIAERHLYLALAGYCIAVAWAVAVGIERRRWLLAAVAVYALALAALTVARNRVLAEPIELWTETVAASPNKARPHVNLGVLLVETGEVEQGAAHLRRAAELDPGDARAQFNLGVYHRQRGDLERAVAAFRAAAAASPRAKYRGELARAANNLGIATFRAGELDTAELLFREALSANPDYPKALYNLAEVRLRRGDTVEARTLLERAIELAPDYARARDRLEQLPR
jgi:Flp pilus assembly protein TadD